MSHDIRICFVGDSFVNGTGDRTALGWAGRVCADAAARSAGVTHYNLGVRRDTSDYVARRWAQECARRLPATCDGRCVFSFGVNDTTMEHGRQRVPMEHSLDNMRRILRGAARYATLMVGPPPVGDSAHNERIQRLSAAFAREAAARGVAFIDVFGVLVSERAYLAEILTSDGAHPGAAGYERLAGIVMASPMWWFR